MKSFYEMLMLLGESSYHDAEKMAYEKVERALAAAGLPWDQDEFNILYGKWVDMTVSVAPNRTERVQGVIYPEEIKNDEGRHGPYAVGFELNNKRFDPTDIEEIHGMKVAKKYEEIIGDWHDDMDYQRTIRSLPR